MPKFEESGTVHVSNVIYNTTAPRFHDEDAFDRNMIIPEEIIPAGSMLLYPPSLLHEETTGEDITCPQKFIDEDCASTTPKMTPRIPNELADSNVCLHAQRSPSSGSLSNYVDFSDIMKLLEDISFELHANLKFTKAIYRGTRKSLLGAKHEEALFVSTRSRSGSPSRGSPGSKPARRSPGSTPERTLNGVRHGRDPQHRQQSPRGMKHQQSALEAKELEKNKDTSTSLACSGTPDKNYMVSSPFAHESLQELASREERYFGSTLAQAGDTVLKADSQMSEMHTMLQKSNAVRIRKFMEDPHSSLAACVFFHSRNLLLILCVVAACIQVFDDNFSSELDTSMTYMQLGIEIAFGIELLMRFSVSSDCIAFVLSGFNIIDLLSALTGFLRMQCLLSGEQPLSIAAFLGLVPVVRLAKMLRHFDTFQLLWNAFLSAAEALPVLIFTLFVIAGTFGSVIFFCEPRSSIPNMPIALYFSIVTVTTLGYGDFVPVSGPGRFWTALLSVIGPMYMAIPIGIIGTAFSQVWEDRNRLLMLHQMRRHLNNVGYTPRQLRRMFGLIDQNGDGNLDVEEFVAWLRVIEVRMPDYIVSQVFESFDTDGEGTIDFNELMRGIYPDDGINNLRKSLQSLRSQKAASVSDAIASV